MVQYDNRSFLNPGARAGAGTAVDQGLRSYMLGVYNYMAAGVALTGIVAYFLHAWAMNDPAVAQMLYRSPLKWVIMLAPLAVVVYFSVRAHRMSADTAQGVFWLYAALFGASISFIFSVFGNISIARTFFVTAAAFGGLSLFGYTTGRDISGWGAFLWMGLIGVIIASIIQLFFPSPALHFAISVIGLLVFAGFTAYDTQAIKDEYYTVAHDAELMAKASVFGALMLYQDFVGIFMNLLSLMGDRD